ncbi:MAG: division/cell wall cluster transcriptional repressor MraZ, partial [Pseudomonadota bacterium]|nr:division/cell wall cluster transcriptional repressor MraZ [Pseudomonadota bacterium]
RVLLPAVLREYAMLDKEVYLVGQGNKFEIWNEKLWNQMCEQWMSEEIDPERLSPELEQLSI